MPIQAIDNVYKHNIIYELN